MGNNNEIRKKGENKNKENNSGLKETADRLNNTLEKLSIFIQKLNIGDYILLIQNPKRLIYLNLISGIARGFGMVLGMTLIFALFIYILTKMVDLPLIGSFIAKIVEIVNQELRK